MEGVAWPVFPASLRTVFVFVCLGERGPVLSSCRNNSERLFKSAGRELGPALFSS